MLSTDLFRVNCKKYVRENCAVCYEECGDCQKDTIISCKKCRSIFHLICLGDTLKDARELNIKCRKCNGSTPRNTVGSLIDNQRSYHILKDKITVANQVMDAFLQVRLQSIVNN